MTPPNSAHVRVDSRVFKHSLLIVSSRQILKSGKHKFKIIVKKPVVGEFLASDGLIKVGFYRADSDPKLSWASPEMDGKCWHYRNLGNLWCGSQSAEESSTPGFAPGDIVTAIVNINAGTAQFCKRSIVRGRTSEEDKEFETSLASINNVQCPAAGLRFGVQVSSCTRVCQFASASCSVQRAGVRAWMHTRDEWEMQMDRDGPGIVMLDYELITAEDASFRAEGWKKLGIQNVGKGKWEEARDCFKKAATFFGEAMDKENRKLLNAMAEEVCFPLRACKYASTHVRVTA